MLFMIFYSFFCNNFANTNSNIRYKLIVVYTLFLIFLIIYDN